MNELQAAMKWLALGQQVVEGGAVVWTQIKAVLAAHGIEADNAILDGLIADAERRKALALSEAGGTD